jgi:hypothetical protein
LGLAFGGTHRPREIAGSVGLDEGPDDRSVCCSVRVVDEPAAIHAAARFGGWPSGDRRWRRFGS